MQYELTIEEAPEKPGTIDMRRLSHITRAITRVAEGALQLQLRGISYVPGRPSKETMRLEAAVEMRLTGLGKSGTRLNIECATLEDTLPSIQLDAFKQAEQESLTKKTPMGLFIETYHRALDGGGEAKDLLDKGLLNELRSIRHAFRTPKERMVIENRGSVRKLELDKGDLKRIRAMEVALPAPELIVINGHLDMIRHSKSLIEIKPVSGKPMEGFLANNLTVEDAQRFLGKEVTVRGMKHTRAGGKRVVEVQYLFVPTPGDRYFSKSYVSEPLEQQLQRQLKKKGGQLKNVAGKWPGDEDLDTILRMLDE